MRARSKRVAVSAGIIGAGIFVLVSYALFVKAQAESLLNDITALTVGVSAESEVKQLTTKHIRYMVSDVTANGLSTIQFAVQNRWLSTLKLEPPAEFRASITVKNSSVYSIDASLLRSMDIYPTFQASAGMVEEYLEYPARLANRSHYEFPTPVGKPYLRVRLDSHATSIQRQHAFGFSLDCLIKPGAGCDVPCDYLPSAWNDWKTELQNAGWPDDLGKVYPRSYRCKK